MIVSGPEAQRRFRALRKLPPISGAMSLGYWETLATIAGDGTAVTNSTTRTSLLLGAGGTQGKYTLTPNKLRIGDVMHLRAMGRMTSVITTPGTFLFELAIGATAIFSSLAILPDTVQAHTDRMWILDAEGTVRTIGSAGNIFWHGFFISEDILGTPATPPKGTVVAVLPWNVAPVVGTAFDMTVANILDFFITMSVATATTSCQLHHYALSLKTSTGF